MFNKWFFLIFILLSLPNLSNAHITADFDNTGAYHENRELDGETWHVHVVPGVDVSWWTYDVNGKVSGIWDVDEVVEPEASPMSEESIDPVVDPVVVDTPPKTPEDPIVPSGGDDPEPPTPTLESAETTTQESVESTEATEPTQPTETDPIPVGGISKPRPLPELRITHIRERNQPLTIFVYVQNNSGYVSGITLEIVSKDGTVKLRRRTDNRDRLWTPQYNHLKDYISPGGIKANNLVAIAPVSVFRKWNYRKETARFRIGVRKFGSRNVYAEDSTIRLLIGDRLITEYPEPEVMGAPMLAKGKMTTTWANIKKRN